MKNNAYRKIHISNRIVWGYVVSCLIWLAAVLVMFFLSWFICTRVILWHSNNPIYQMLKILEKLSPIIVVGALVVGIFVLAIVHIKRVLRFLSDITDAAKSLSRPDEEPIVLPAELNDIQNELNLARERALRNIDAANDAVQRKNELIMYLAHDLKTPLASVIGYLNLLKDEGQISEELRERYLSISLKKAERLEDLINEFFEISRFNLSTVTLVYGKINLTRLLEQLAHEFKPMLNDKRLSCILSTNGEITLNCDADKLQRVFDNLLRNAVIYSYEDTEIHIRAKSLSESVIITFANSGDTIPPEKLDRIFEQFYRLDAARSTSGGAGLGLAIARQIVELHGGKITAKSHKGQTEFEVTLPLS